MKFYKIVLSLVLLLFADRLFAQKLYNKNQYSLIFNYDTYSNTKVDFKKMTIENSVLKIPAKLNLSAKEEGIIERSFNSNRIAVLRGEIDCFNDRAANTPITNYEVKVFSKGRLLSTITYNEIYDVVSAPKNRKNYKPARFVYDVQKMLENNSDFKKAIKALRDYEVKNNFIRL